MTIQIDRFEKREVNHNKTQVIIDNKTAILIKDHKTDNIVSFIQLENHKEKNAEIADRIIAAIEAYIEEQENE